MEVQQLALQATNALATAYIREQFPLDAGFHYALHSSSFAQRARDVRERTYDRARLVDHLLRYHQQFAASERTIHNIHRLLDERAVVVIGGQQPGLLTGPLYTIHKIISIVTLAKQKERELGIPVVPVFWMASEDHDVAEINHVYVCADGDVRKHTYRALETEKKMMADMQLDADACQAWIDELLSTYEETDVTNDVRAFLFRCLQKGTTVADFFAAIVLELFGSEGIVVVDAAHRELRQLEREQFQTLIQAHETITEALFAQQARLRTLGYERTIQTEPTSAHLFSYDGQRRAVHYDRERKQFYTKDSVYRWTMNDLLRIASDHPQRLSNNVVTRPLMQEYMFPTLAFVAGPGEIAYWAELKDVFARVGLSMPPVVPRLSVTLVERSVASYMQQLNVSLEEVLTNGTARAMRAWLEQQTPMPIEETIAEAKRQIERIHASVRQIGMEVDRHLEPFMLKNAALIQTQLDFLRQQLTRRLTEKHDVVVRKYEKVERALRPNGMMQERVWNAFYYINKYGFDFIVRLAAVDYRWNGLHHVVFI